MFLPKQRTWIRYGARFASTATGGIQGVDGRAPVGINLHSASNSVVLTDPFAVYQNYVRTRILEHDEAQLRAMKEFQKLYFRVLDYKPPEDLAIKSSILMRKLEVRSAREALHDPRALLSKLKLWVRSDLQSHQSALIRSLSDEEALENIAAPRGLLVNGEVGCGKSMLMDIFASSLPHQSKMRWHYNNFILWVFSEIHRVQSERVLLATGKGRRLLMENEFILYEVAQRMIAQSTIFMLDEFMLPDIASAQICRILFTFYFRLGGVLVATSNKLPEELYSQNFNRENLDSFVGILHSRCVAVDMKSKVDYRQHFAGKSTSTSNYIVENAKSGRAWRLLVSSAVDLDVDSVDAIPWKKDTLVVYKRELVISRLLNDVCYVDFNFVCCGSLGSSDFISLASRYHTVIVDHVPVMTTKMKNEARRFITLLDALYEAKCQLFLRCEAPVEHLFFPAEETQQLGTDAVQEEEMFARTAMQTENPYRPNVSSYDQSYAKEYLDAGKPEHNFSNTLSFTGEDEQFAFKRAVSRIQEMVSSDHWRKESRWVPIDPSMRPWEKESTLFAARSGAGEESEVSLPVKEIKARLQTELPRDVSRNYNLPFQQYREVVAPRFFSLQHFWAMGQWTMGQRQKIKDRIAQSWISGSIK